MHDHQPILVVQADDCLGPAITEQLLADGYPAKLAKRANHATVLARHKPPALVILGELDTATGALALLRTIRGSGAGSPWRPEVPIIMISAECEQTDTLRAFEAGADDFMESPPSYLELRARLRAVLRRACPTGHPVIQVGPLRIDTAAHAATLHHKRLELRCMEYDLLVHLAGEPTRVFRAPEILRTVWGYPEPGRTRTLDSHASRLRRKLNAVGGRWVINVRRRLPADIGAPLPRPHVPGRDPVSCAPALDADGWDGWPGSHRMMSAPSDRTPATHPCRTNRRVPWTLCGLAGCARQVGAGVIGGRRHGRSSASRHCCSWRWRRAYRCWRCQRRPLPVLFPLNPLVVASWKTPTILGRSTPMAM